MRAFYRDAHVEEFFDAQRPLLDAVQDRLRRVVERNSDSAWFDTFFGGVSAPEFFVIPAPLNGNAQYAAKFTSGALVREAYAVIGVYTLEEDGGPRFDREDAHNIVHEFAHTLTDSAVTAHLPELDDVGPALFTSVQARMREQGYGQWQTMVYEAVVRAVVVRFIAAHQGATAAREQIEAQQKLGFRGDSEVIGGVRRVSAGAVAISELRAGDAASDRRASRRRPLIPPGAIYVSSRCEEAGPGPCYLRSPSAVLCTSRHEITVALTATAYETAACPTLSNLVRCSAGVSICRSA